MVAKLYIQLKIVRISASDLQMGTEAHFDTVSLKMVITDEMNRNTLVDNIISFVEKQKQKRGGILDSIKLCEADIFKKLEMLKGGMSRSTYPSEGFDFRAQKSKPS